MTVGCIGQPAGLSARLVCRTFGLVAALIAAAFCNSGYVDATRTAESAINTSAASALQGSDSIQSGAGGQLEDLSRWGTGS